LLKKLNTSGIHSYDIMNINSFKNKKSTHKLKAMTKSCDVEYFQDQSLLELKVKFEIFIGRKNFFLVNQTVSFVRNYIN
jgi:hypothetical protein